MCNLSLVRLQISETDARRKQLALNKARADRLLAPINASARKDRLCQTMLQSLNSTHKK